ncbi:MAG: enoyl-CoA hydratase/isomerase family protein [Gammaproteobacteria bacterium AqS3]|nr:enoyl-CoA hydratase/isomerase family protein [Gammaproteobacteria bacterium AqS3]
MTKTVTKSGKLIIEKKGPVTRLTLNRPECHNALDRELSQELHDALRAVDIDRECRVMILTGAGNTFCTGDDIKEFNDWKPEDAEWQVRLYQQTVTILEKLVPVTIAAVDGVCTGGGLELTLSSDFVIATPRSRWGMPEINWDITPGWGGTAKIAKYAGRRKAKEWNLLGTLFSGAKAERYDLVNRLVEPDQLESEVERLTEIILSKHPQAVRCTKFFLDNGADLDYANVMAFEGAPQRVKFGQGIKDFVEKESRDKRRELLDGFWFD